jgi:hypothetical protein
LFAARDADDAAVSRDALLPGEREGKKDPFSPASRKKATEKLVTPRAIERAGRAETDARSTGQSTAVVPHAAPRSALRRLVLRRGV